MWIFTKTTLPSQGGSLQEQPSLQKVDLHNNHPYKKVDLNKNNAPYKGWILQEGPSLKKVDLQKTTLPSKVDLYKKNPPYKCALASKHYTWPT